MFAISQESQSFLLNFSYGVMNTHQRQTARQGGWYARPWQSQHCSLVSRPVQQIPQRGRADQEPNKLLRKQDSEVDSSFPAKVQECLHELIICPAPISKTGDWKAQEAFRTWQERAFFVVVAVYSSFFWELKAFLCWVRTAKTAQMLKIYTIMKMVGKNLKMPVWRRWILHGGVFWGAILKKLKILLTSLLLLLLFT